MEIGRVEASVWNREVGMNLVQGVAAIIVTYNRAEKLERVIKCVQRQTHPVKWILVIDNASTDDTADVLSRFSDDSRLKVFSLTENTGGAGGFAHGMSWTTTATPSQRRCNCSWSAWTLPAEYSKLASASLGPWSGGATGLAQL